MHHDQNLRAVLRAPCGFGFRNPARPWVGFVKVIDGIDGLAAPLSASILTIGNFDGLHLAHQSLVRRARSLAAKVRVPAVVLTFEPHPLTIVAPNRVPPLLTPRAEKLRLLDQLGADVVVIARSEPALLNLEAEDFVRHVVVQRFRPVVIVEGLSFGFGKGRKGTPQLLARMAAASGFQLAIVEAVSVELVDGRREAVSSSLVRKLLSEGRVEDASRCLGRPYRLMGTVIAGEKRGRALGFPTANLDAGSQMIPADGVYGATAWVADDRYTCALSIGHTPTFSGTRRLIEAHLLDFADDLYGRQLSVDLQSWVRPQQTFASAEDLVRQLKQDVQTVRSTVGFSRAE